MSFVQVRHALSTHDGLGPAGKTDGWMSCLWILLGFGHELGIDQLRQHQDLGSFLCGVQQQLRCLWTFALRNVCALGILGAYRVLTISMVPKVAFRGLCPFWESSPKCLKSALEMGLRLQSHSCTFENFTICTPINPFWSQWGSVPLQRSICLCGTHYRIGVLQLPWRLTLESWDFSLEKHESLK